MTMSPDDEAILQLAQDLSVQLHLPRLAPRKLLWEDHVTIYGASIQVPSDLVSIGRGNIVLAKRIRGKLTREEWTPLIASSLIFLPWVRSKSIKTLGWAAIGVAMLYLPIVFFALTFLRYGIFSTAGMILLHPGALLLLGVTLFVIVGRFYSPDARRELLKADRQAAEMFGKDVFIDVLQKIRTLGWRMWRG